MGWTTVATGWTQKRGYHAGIEVRYGRPQDLFRVGAERVPSVRLEARQETILVINGPDGLDALDLLYLERLGYRLLVADSLSAGKTWLRKHPDQVRLVLWWKKDAGHLYLLKDLTEALPEAAMAFDKPVQISRVALNMRQLLSAEQGVPSA